MFRVLFVSIHEKSFPQDKRSYSPKAKFDVAITLGTFYPPKRQILTPAQCRASRALLGWTEPELAEPRDLSKSTIIDFEINRGEVSDTVISTIKSALEAGGAVFDSGRIN